MPMYDFRTVKAGGDKCIVWKPVADLAKRMGFPLVHMSRQFGRVKQPNDCEILDLPKTFQSIRKDVISFAIRSASKQETETIFDALRKEFATNTGMTRLSPVEPQDYIRAPCELADHQSFGAVIRAKYPRVELLLSELTRRTLMGLIMSTFLWFEVVERLRVTAGVGAPINGGRLFQVLDSGGGALTGFVGVQFASKTWLQRLKDERVADQEKNKSYSWRRKYPPNVPPSGTESQFKAIDEPGRDALRAWSIDGTFKINLLDHLINFFNSKIEQGHQELLYVDGACVLDGLPVHPDDTWQDLRDVALKEGIPLVYISQHPEPPSGLVCGRHMDVERDLVVVAVDDGPPPPPRPPLRLYAHEYIPASPRRHAEEGQRKKLPELAAVLAQHFGKFPVAPLGELRLELSRVLRGDKTCTDGCSDAPDRDSLPPDDDDDATASGAPPLQGGQ